MKSWQFAVMWVALPCITLLVVVTGMMLYRQIPSWMLIGALIGVSLCCAGVLRQMYNLRTDPRVAVLFGGVFGIVAGCMLLLIVSVLDQAAPVRSLIR